MRSTVRSIPIVAILFVTVGCSSVSEKSLPQQLQPPPVQEAVTIERVPLDGSVNREDASSLTSVQYLTIPQDQTDTEAGQLLGDGTLYRLELDRFGREGAALVRFDHVANEGSVATRIPLIAPAGQQIRTEAGAGLRVATSSPGVQMDRNRHGTVWWEEDGPKGRLIEFRIDGDHATMVLPGASTDDPKAPIARRFNATPDREVPFRFTTGAVDIGRDTPRAYLGGRGFGLGLSRIGIARTEAFLESPAYDLPHVDVAESAPGQITVTIGYITGSERGAATQVTYDANARSWKDHRPLAVFARAQTVEVADVAASGALVNLILPWNGDPQDPETGLYWIRPGQAVRHLLLRIRDLKAVTVDDGFVALFQDEFKEGVQPEDQNDMFVLRAREDRVTLQKFQRPGPSGAQHFVWLGGNRFVATFNSSQVVVFEVP
jgi:hypothetical protein